MTSPTIYYLGRVHVTPKPQPCYWPREHVFFGGSRGITRLDAPVRSALDGIIKNDHWVFVGDAYGADRAVQRHLACRGAERVIVYAMDGYLRNRAAPWQVRLVEPPAGARGFDLFSVKDRVMAQSASAGFMLWDGSSRGTLANIKDLVAQGKPVAVYLATEKRLVVVRSAEDLRQLLAEVRVGAGLS